MTIEITNQDLLKNNYNIETLEANISRLDLRYLVYYQKLNAYFCVKYILDPDDKYASCVEDSFLDYQDILDYQSHITKDELEAEIIKQRLK